MPATHHCPFMEGASRECVVIKKKRGNKYPMVEKITENGILVYAVNLDSPALDRRLMLFKMLEDDANAGGTVPT